MLLPVGWTLNAEVVGTVEDIMPVIKRNLGKAGKYQRDLAEHLGVSEKHVSHMMTGRTGVTLPMLFQMLAYLDMPLVLMPPPAPLEPTKDQSYCDVGQHGRCSGHTEDELDPETCFCSCHDPEGMYL